MKRIRLSEAFKAAPLPLQVDFRRRVLKGGATGAGLPAFDTHPSPSAQLRNKGVWCVQVDASAEHRRTGTQHGRERRPLTTNAAAERPAERRRLCAKRPEARASTSLLRAFRHRPLRLQPSLSPPPSRHGTLSLRSVQQRSSGPKGGADAKTQAPSTTRLRVIRPPVLFFFMSPRHMPGSRQGALPSPTHRSGLLCGSPVVVPVSWSSKFGAPITTPSVLAASSLDA